MPDIPPLLAAANDVLAVLAAAGHRACLIGGLAVQRWGEPRTTQDVDVSVLAPYGDEHQVVTTLLHAYPPRIQGAREFAVERRVLLVKTPAGVNIDVALAAYPFEQEAIDGAVGWSPLAGIELRVCPPEHLILYKLVAGRPQDLVDIAGVVRRQMPHLDVEEVRRWGRQFAEVKEDPGLLRPFEDALRQNP
ncbi:MAG TPA: nucleotidyl transferase AbiEii/AbiGii toxin family protein [Vicinamibacterales bacterium]|nr:nucleotidyl transferase AbiEii/AbiGii toxin family protein [Vicinamibacterales bacterium]